MGKRLDGGVLMVFAVTLLFLAAASTFFVFVYGFDWEPDDRSVAYWQAEIPTRQWILAIGVAVPAASMATAAASTFALPRRPVRIIAGGLVAVLALGLMVISCILGNESLATAQYWAARASGSYPR
ncbi:hypothetical protein OVA06_03450 [Pseudarthrobacter sp. SL88]|uniref:hypothetical protein n=1 Tax=Pseudarthrobacter sp. SL88 TaxID=2994666 RepID=UPI0022768EB0|nr:hypothetical protein [Pseudarthrobacter sp. SL88]MCY1673780.1 hypothetical protein [Pseudarthrobacter sp. SL88]